MKSRGSTLFALALTLAAGLVLGSALGPAPRATAKEERHLSTREWKKLMNGWARGLGVKCAHCHVRKGEEFDYEAPTPKKAIAAYCEEHFVDRLQLRGKQVSCIDCHQRKPQFLPRPEGDEEEGATDEEGEDQGEE